MKFTVAADTDIGIARKTNQDSILVKHAKCDLGEVLLAVVCDGMGGLSKGELASATVVHAFSDWFDEELPYELEEVDMQVIGGKWSLLLRKLNVKISEYGKSLNMKLGTTFTSILFIGNEYVISHIGDSRIYYIGSSLKQLTADQTFVAREVIKGNITVEQARIDRHRNILLQCIGASSNVEPQIVTGKIQQGIYMICTDGFYHKITENEIYELLNPQNLVDKNDMYNNARYLIGQAKFRQEKDNISIVLIKTE